VARANPPAPPLKKRRQPRARRMEGAANPAEDTIVPPFQIRKSQTFVPVRGRINRNACHMYKRNFNMAAG